MRYRYRFRALRAVRSLLAAGVIISVLTIGGLRFLRSQTASAATLSPTTEQELAAAVASAAPGDTIDLSGAPSATITLHSPLTINKNLTLANGTLLVAPPPLTLGGAGRHIEITAPISLTLDSINIKGRKTSATDTTAGGGILINPIVAGGTVSLIGNGTVSDCFNAPAPMSSYSSGGIDNNSASVTLRIDGINITNNSTYGMGGGIQSLGPLDFISGTISGNSATFAGGGIYMGNAPLTLAGGTISNNSSVYGGGVSISDSHLVMTGTTIADNTATYGGGIFGGRALYGGGTVPGSAAATIELSGSSIVSGNTATNFGGGIYTDGSTITVTDSAQITGNSTGTSGGGIYSEQTASAVTIDGNALIDDNHADANGAGIRTTGALTINSGTISNNDALGLGGGVFMSGSGKTMTVASGAMINDNEAGQNGGGIYMNIGTLSMGGTVTRNTAVGDTSPRLNGAGGGIFLSTGTRATITATSIVTDNVAQNGRGGAVYLQTFPQLTTELGATFAGNTAFYAVPWEISDNDMSMQEIIATYNTQIHSNTMSTLAGSDNIYDGYDVNFAPLISNEPIIDEPMTVGDRIVTGIGDTPGATITVYFRDGDGDPTNNPRVTAVVGADGAWEVAVPDGVDLATGDVVEATQTANGLIESTADDAVVREDDSVVPPVVPPVDEIGVPNTGVGQI